MKEVIETSNDLLVDFCDSGKYYDYYKMKPNKGNFDETFLVKFIGLVKNSMYSPEYEPIIERGCDKAVKNIKKFAVMMRKEIVKGCGEEEDGCTWKADEPLVINILNSLDKIILKTS